MVPALVRLPLVPEFLSIGFCVGLVVGAMAGTSAAVERPMLEVSAPEPATAVHVSISALDLSRLVPAQFGDWDGGASTPEP